MDTYFKLHRRLQLFVDAHVATGSAAGAVRKLGYKTKYAPRRGYKLMQLKGVREAIEERKAEAIAEAGVTQVRVLTELAAVAFSDLRQLFNDDRTIKPASEWPDGLAQAIASVEVEGLFAGSGKDRVQIGDVLKVKAWPKIDALRTLAQHLKMLTEKHEHTGKDGAPLVPPAPTVTPEQLREAVLGVRDKF